MFKKILLVLVLIIAVMAVVVAMQPSEFHVERSAVMDAPPAEVFAQVNDFHNWQAWSPWAKIDPNAKATFEGPSSGEGAVFRWAGNNEIGEGSMTITESKPHELIKIRLDFLKPMEGTSGVQFTFAPVDGDKTKVVWSMEGKNNFIGKAMCLVMNMDQMIGDMYDQGLANIKKIVEGNGAAPEMQPAAKPTATAAAN